MRIFYQPGSDDPMVLGREADLRSFAKQLREVAAGDRARGAYTAQTDGCPEPYSEFLPGVRVEQSGGSQPECYLAPDRWLELRASAANLEELCRNIEGLRSGDHVHLYSAPISLIFEADDTWPGFNGG
jgi:hypothetical protein